MPAIEALVDLSSRLQCSLESPPLSHGRPLCCSRQIVDAHQRYLLDLSELSHRRALNKCPELGRFQRSDESLGVIETRSGPVPLY